MVGENKPEQCRRSHLQPVWRPSYCTASVPVGLLSAIMASVSDPSPLWSHPLRSMNLDGFPGRRHGQLADPRSGSSAAALRGQSLRITDTLHRIYATETRAHKDLFLSREAPPCWASSCLLPPGKLEMNDAVHGPRLFMLPPAVRPPYQLVSRSYSLPTPTRRAIGVIAVPLNTRVSPSLLSQAYTSV